MARNKKCITLNLGHDRGRDLLKRLAADSDVLVENYRAGTLDRWGLGWNALKEVNPRLVMVRTSGFGQDGPYSSYPGFGTLAESMSGFANITGEEDGPPQLPQFPLADGMAAMVGTIGALAGIYRVKAEGGSGQWIDNSLYEPIMRLMELSAMEYAHLGTVRKRSGNRIKDTVPRGAYKTAEEGRWVALSGSNPATARRILQAIEREDLVNDPRLADNQGRAQHADLVDEALATWIGAHTVAEVLDRFRQADAPIAPIYDIAGVMQDEHFRARQTHVRVPDDELGEVTMQTVMPRFSETPGEIRFAGPNMGAHNDEVYLGRLGLSQTEVDELKAQGTI
jgi:formyl-CoA transferase